MKNIRSTKLDRAGSSALKTIFLMMVGLTWGVGAAFFVNHFAKKGPEQQRKNAVKELSGGFTEEQMKQINENMNNQPLSAEL